LELARPLKQEANPKLDLTELDAIVINLERRPDRLDGCVARVNAYCQWLQTSRFTACDGRVTNIDESDCVYNWNTSRNVAYQKKRAIRKGWNDLDSYAVRDLVLSSGERGCAMSHINAWKFCIERAAGTERPLLVLEDDAAPTADFTAKLTRAASVIPADAHVLYLGYSQATDWRREISADLVESEYVWTTVAYVIWPAGARYLLNQLPVDQPVDNFMAHLAARGDLRAYCVRPKIIRQAEAWNVNSDVGHSDENYWGPCSDIHHSDDFYWGALPKASPAGTSETTSEGGNATFLAGGSCFWDINSEESDDSAEA
jgi:GR25 family glycosyltransferase involved in LPS biosynthesis